MEAADATVKERLFLIGKDGINGPDHRPAAEETTANVNGAGDCHFNDPAFVKAAKDMHEAKLLAEGGFTGSQRTARGTAVRTRREGTLRPHRRLGREIENRVTGNDSNRLKDQGLKAETTSAADYGSAEHHEKFAESLANTGANERPDTRTPCRCPQRGHTPQCGSNHGQGRSQSRKSRTGAAVGAERGKNGLSR